MKKLSEVNRTKKELRAPSNRAFSKKYISTNTDVILTSEELNDSFINETMKHIKTNFAVSCSDLRTIHSILKRGVKMY